MQMWPVWSRMYPGEHSHSYDPSVSIHIPFKHTPGPSSSHSSISSHMWFAVLNRIPLGQIHCANIIKRLDWSRPIPPILGGYLNLIEDSTRQVFLLAWKLPGVLRHWPPLHNDCSNSHSFISVHIFPVASTS